MKNWWIRREKAVYSDSRLKSCSHRRRTRPTDKQTWWDLKDRKSHQLVQNCHPFELSTMVTSTWIHLSNRVSNCWWLKHQAQRDGRGGLAPVLSEGQQYQGRRSLGLGTLGGWECEGAEMGVEAALAREQVFANWRPQSLSITQKEVSLRTDVNEELRGRG